MVDLLLKGAEGDSGAFGPPGNPGVKVSIH